MDILSKLIEKYDLTQNMNITNFNGIKVGKFHIGVIKETMEKLNMDFIVSNITETPECINITIEELRDLTDFIYELKLTDQKHDKYIGDGKYW